MTEYMLEQNVNAVEVTVEMFRLSDGSLLFVFGPSGAYFNPHLELTLMKGYASKHAELVGEDGELLESTSENVKRAKTYYIPHFSRYAYDSYSYY